MLASSELNFAFWESEIEMYVSTRPFMFLSRFCWVSRVEGRILAGLVEGVI